MKKKRIGIVMDSVEGIYQERIMQSIVKQTKHKDIDLFFICSLGLVDVPGEFEVHQGVLTLANTPFLDGLIFVMATFTNYFSKDWINELIQSYDTKVIVSIGYESEYGKNVVFDNVTSIEKVMEHLIKDLNCKSIGYISGPLENEDAIARYEGYKMVLNDYSIEINKQFFFEGYFLEYTGKKAIKELITKAYEIPDAIVCASDEIAIGAIVELLENGVTVPYTIKVTGFDNISASAAFEIPLTTVEQPLDLMVSKALDYLDQEFYGKKIEVIEHITGDLIKRESTREIKSQDSLKIGGLRETKFLEENIIGPLIRFEDELQANLDRLRNDFFEDFEFEDQADEIFKKMIKGLILDVRTAESKGMFLKQAKELSTILVQKMPYSLFNLRFNKFKQFASDLVFNSQLFYRIQEVMFDAVIAINNHFYSLESVMKHKVEDLYVMSRSFVNIADKAKTLDEYLKLIRENIRRHALFEFYLCLYAKPIYGDLLRKIELPTKAKMVIGVNKDIILKPEEFETKKLFPESIYNLSELKNLVIMDIVRDNVHYGYLSLTLDIEETQFYETIRLSISQGIHRLMS